MRRLLSQSHPQRRKQPNKFCCKRISALKKMNNNMTTILVSDDSHAMLQMLTFVLQSAGYELQTTNNGKDALQLAQQQTFDLIITDFNMPDLDGLSLLRLLREMPQYKFKPILLLTTETDPAIKQAAREAKATGWINKPFDPDKLLAAVKKVLG